VTTVTVANGTKAVSVYWLRLPEHTDMFTQGYVGISNNTQKRFSAHKKSKQNPHLFHAIEKYGFDNLIKQILLISDKTYCLDIEKKLRPEKMIGWNLEAGGGNPPSLKNKSSFSKGFVPWNKGLPMSDETKAKVSASKKGAKLSVETRAKMTASRLGKAPYQMTDEVRAKISASLMGNTPWNKGKKYKEQQ
jgi:predicted GIY-YIG superfamily endonuclease